MSVKYIVVLITVGSLDEAHTLSRGLVKEKLAYCVNQFPGIKSTYFWEDKICVDTEIQLVAKTMAHKFLELEKWIKANHSYDTPEVIALPIIKGSREYLKCVNKWCV